MGWKSKFIFLLIVYFAGFATAVYWLVPGENESEACFSENTGISAINTDGFARGLKTGMDQCMEFTKEAVAKANELIKDKINEKRGAS